MASDKRVEVDGSNLPNELLPLIANNLHATIDILRFRSTCTSWRSAAPLPPPSSQTLFSPPTSIPRSLSPPSPLHTIFPPGTGIPQLKFTLVETKIYSLEPSSTYSTTDSSKKGWIIIADDSKSQPVRLLDPFTNEPLSDTHPSYDTTHRKVLNLLNFRVTDLVEAYSLKYGSERIRGVLKAVPFPKHGGVVALYEDGKLRASEIGDEEWRVLDGGNPPFDDVILYKGKDHKGEGHTEQLPPKEQVYAVDRSGGIWWVDCSSSTLVEFYPGLSRSGKKKRLVECDNGRLYMVDIYIGQECHHRGMHWEDIDGVKVHRLVVDEGGGRWFDENNLGDAAFVLGKDSSFSLSASHYYGCEGNCVYFRSGKRVCAFSLENYRPTSYKPFWPCPSLFDPKFNL